MTPPIAIRALAAALPALAPALALAAALAPAGAQAQPFSAMVADVETGTMLTADGIDAARDPNLLARLTTVAMGIQDIADETLDADEEIDIRASDAVPAMTALQATALGEEGYRAPMTALAARIGYNAELFEDRMRAIRTRAGLQASSVEVVRGEDGGPAFDGQTTIRDTARLATSLLRAHEEIADEVFGPSTGFIPTTHMWLSDGDACLLAADGPRTGRMLVAALAGAPSEAACFEAAATLLSEQDGRIRASQ